MQKMTSSDSTHPAPIPVVAKRGSAAAQMQSAALSTSPHSNASEVEADNEQLDEVFSNPDTADLGYRSDGTGATSPGPNSPGPSSPLSRSVLGSAMAGKSVPLPSEDSATSPPALRLHSLPNFPKQAASHQTIRAFDGSNPEVATLTEPRQTQPTSPRSLASSPQTLVSASAAGRRDAAVASPRRLSANIGSFPGPGALPAANDLPTDPVEASTVSRLFAHPPAASPVPQMPTSVASPPRTPGLGARAAISGLPMGSPTVERGSMFFRPSRSATRPSSPDTRHRAEIGIVVGQPTTSTTKAARSADGPQSPSSVASGAVGLPSPPVALAASAMPASGGVSASSQSIFERDIEHRDASHIMSKQEAVDVAIPSVLDDAVEAIIEDGTEQIEVVAPQTPAPPLALSSVALSVHSGASSPALAAFPPSPAVSSTQFEAPPGSMAAQIAERLGSRHGTALTDDAKQAGSTLRKATGHHRRPGSDVSSATSLRSRSPQAITGKGMHEVLDASPVRCRTSASPAPPAHASLAAAVSQASRAPSTTIPAPVGSASPLQPAPGSSILAAPTATAFPSLPLPNPYRSSSPNLAAISVPMMSGSMQDGGRPALSSLSIDGAVISGSEVASLDHSLDSLADVIAASDAEEAASPYVPRSPAVFNYASGTSSPTMEKYKMRKGKGGGDGRQGSVGGGLGTMPGGLGVFDAFEGGSLMALSSGAPSPSQEKRRLSFFAYADILNQNPGEVMDFEGVVRQAAERDDQQHGYTAGHGKQASTLSQTAGGSAMSRSVSTSAADQRRSGAAARLSSISGANTPLRGRREVLENQALANRLESLNLASNAEALATEQQQ
ncbi:hypothetical protein ACQY0O_003343 [Thecaphora frezii]